MEQLAVAKELSTEEEIQKCEEVENRAISQRRQHQSNIKSVKSNEDHNNDDFDQLIPDESDNDSTASPQPHIFDSKISLTELQPRKRFTICGSRHNLLPYNLMKDEAFAFENNVLDSDQFMRSVSQGAEAILNLRRQAHSFKQQREDQQFNDGFACPNNQEPDDVLYASLSNRPIKRECSHNLKMFMQGSGKPLIDINEDKNEDLISSGDDSCDGGAEDDGLQNSKDFSLKFKQMLMNNLSSNQVSINYPGDMGHHIQDRSVQNRKPSLSDSNVVKSLQRQDLEEQSLYNLQNEHVIPDDDLFLIEKDLFEEEEVKENTPRFGDIDRFKNLKFIFRNEQQRTRFIKELDQLSELWLNMKSSEKFEFVEKKCKLSKIYTSTHFNRLESDKFSTATGTEQFTEGLRKTIVFCDLHKLLVYIRKSSHSPQDILIRTKSSGIQVRFYVSIRRGMVQALLKLRQQFEVLLYSSLDQEMGDAIIDHIEAKLAKGRKLFDQRFHGQDCDTLTCNDLKINEIKQRSLNVLIQSQIDQQSSKGMDLDNQSSFLSPQQKPSSAMRSDKTVIFVTSCMKEVVNHITNIVPIKSYDGKRSKNSTLMTLAVYLYKRMLATEDVREIVKQDILKFSEHCHQIIDTLKQIEQQNQEKEDSDY